MSAKGFNPHPHKSQYYLWMLSKPTWLEMAGSQLLPWKPTAVAAHCLEKGLHTPLLSAQCINPQGSSTVCPWTWAPTGTWRLAHHSFPYCLDSNHLGFSKKYHHESCAFTVIQLRMKVCSYKTLLFASKAHIMVVISTQRKKSGLWQVQVIMVIIPAQMQSLDHSPVSTPLVINQGNLMNMIEFVLCNRKKNAPLDIFKHMCMCMCILDGLINPQLSGFGSNLTRSVANMLEKLLYGQQE